MYGDNRYYNDSWYIGGKCSTFDVIFTHVLTSYVIIQRASVVFIILNDALLYLDYFKNILELNLSVYKHKNLYY